MLKKIAIGGLILVVALLGIGQYLWSNIDSIVKASIEKYGSAAAQTDVRLDSVKLSLTSGEGTVSGLSVSNPKGFSGAKAFYLSAISMKLDTGSVTGNGPIVIREIVIEKPQVTYEINKEGNNNLQTIERNMTAHTATTDKTSSSASNRSSSSSSGKSGRKIIINDLYIRDGQIAASEAFVPDKSFSTPLPTIHLSNIGKGQGGASPEQIAQQILENLTASTVKVVSNDMISKFGASLKGNAGQSGNIEGQLKGLLGGK